MTTSTKLMLWLMVAVSVVMALVGVVLLQLRTNALEQYALDLVRAHARTLQIAIEERHSTNADVELKPLLERLVRENQAIANIILYDARGEMLTAAPSGLNEAQLDVQAARQAMATRHEIKINRRIANQEVISLILPETASDSPFGAIEISVAVAFVRTEVVSERNDIVFLGLITCFTMFGVVWLVTRRSLGRPIRELVTGAEAVGKGDLNFRVATPSSSGDFKALSNAFNQMATSLSEQRQIATQEAEARLELERRLHHSERLAERLAAVGHLAAGVAHEMGAPLQVIDGRAKQLQEQAHPTADKLQRNLKIIRTQGERITRIVRTLLTLARPVHPRFRSVDLRQQAELALEALETQALQNRVAYDHASGSPLWVKADPDLLQQVLTNLFVNAIQAMPEGGTLRVSYPDTPLDKDGRAFIGMRVADTGYGIAPENLPQIFDAFFTTKEVGSGTGLGLSISSRIVEEHEGWLKADNWTNGNGEGGAVFTLYLPQAPANVSAAATELATGNTGNTGKIIGLAAFPVAPVIPVADSISLLN